MTKKQYEEQLVFEGTDKVLPKLLNEFKTPLIYAVTKLKTPILKTIKDTRYVNSLLHTRLSKKNIVKYSNKLINFYIHNRPKGFVPSKSSNNFINDDGVIITWNRQIVHIPPSKPLIVSTDPDTPPWYTDAEYKAIKTIQTMNITKDLSKPKQELQDTKDNLQTVLKELYPKIDTSKITITSVEQPSKLKDIRKVHTPQEHVNYLLVNVINNKIDKLKLKYDLNDNDIATLLNN